MKIVLFITAVAVAAITVEATLVDTLNTIHNSPAFKALTHAEQLVLVELFAEAEAGEVKAYIDSVGFQNVLDVIENLPQTEAHRLTEFLIQELNSQTTTTGGVSETTTTGGVLVIGKRELASALQYIKNNAAFQLLPAADQQLINEMIQAAETNTLTQLVDRVGYAAVLTLIDSLPANEQHDLDQYLINHLKMESQSQNNGL